MLESSYPAPWYRRFRSSPTFILLTVCVAIFNDVFLFGTIIPILPYALPDRVDIDYKDVQIYIAVLLAAYGGALLIASLLFGWLGDRVKRRHPIFLLGLCALLAATGILALGRTMWLLALGRFLQGTSAAVVWTSGLGLLTDIFGQERYGETVGWANMAVSVGTTSAPLLGGLVYSKGGYGAVSMMSGGVVLLALVMGLLMKEPKSVRLFSKYNGYTPTQNGYYNHHANGTRTNGNANGHTETYADANGHIHRKDTANGNETGSDSDESSEQTPLIPASAKPTRVRRMQPAYGLLLKSSRILAAMSGIFTFSFVIISMEAMIPLFVKDTFHWDSSKAALMYLCWIIPSFLGPIAGKVADRFGSRWVAVFGLLLGVPPLILLRLVDHDSIAQKVLMCAMLTLTGFAFVWIQPACMGDLSTAADELKRDYPDEFGDSGASSQAFGLFVFSYSTGCLLGPTIAGILNARVSWGASTLILAMACVLTCIPISLKLSTASRRSGAPALV